MGRITRYDQAQPARDNYFSTFVPLPLEQLTALGMSRKQDLEKNQALLEKAYDAALDIKYIRESPKEEAHYRDITKAVTDLALKYSTRDTTQSFEMSNMRRELRQAADPALIKRMEESYAGHQDYRKLEADLKSKGLWSDLLNENKAALHDSETGVFSALPEAYMGRKALLGQYFDNLPVSFKGVDKGFMVHGVRNEDINRIANERASEIALTPGGKQEVRMYKKQYPQLAEDMSDNDIINLIARDYAEKELHDVYHPLPEYMAKGSQPFMPQSPMENLSASTVENFRSISQVKAKMQKLEAEGSIEETKDLRRAFDYVSKKYDLDKIDIGLEDVMVDSPKALAKTGVAGYMPLKDYSVTDRKIIKEALAELSSTTATRYAFGFTSEQLDNAKDPLTGKKMGLSDFETLSSNFLVHPLDYETIDIDGKGVVKPKEKVKLTSFMNTKNLEDVSIDILPNAKKEFKPVITLGYGREKDGITTHHSAKIVINDITQAAMIASMLETRNNYQGAAAVMNPHAAHAIKYDNFDTPKTYKIITADKKESLLKVQLNEEDPRKFDITFDQMDPRTGALSPSTTISVDSRIELISEIYNILGQNRYSTFAKTEK